MFYYLASQKEMKQGLEVLNQQNLLNINEDLKSKLESSNKNCNELRTLLKIYEKSDNEKEKKIKINEQKIFQLEEKIQNFYQNNSSYANRIEQIKKETWKKETQLQEVIIQKEKEISKISII